MARKARELSALEVSRLKLPGRYAVGGVAGLHLQVADSGARSWILRVSIGTARRDMGLGGFPDVTLAMAREKARDARAKIESGADPILARQKAKSALSAAQASAITFKEATTRFLDARGDEWRNAKHRQQWENTLRTYAFPHIGDLLVRDVGKDQVMKVLEPIWRTKTETASRVRGRIEQVLAWATVHKFREGENPARWRGHLDQILAKPGKIAKVTHHEALPIDAVGAFMRDLRARDGLAARALEFTILTAARSGETRGATWDEIDLTAKLWTIPAERMKAGKEHRVPLTKECVALLKTLPRRADTPFVFAGPRGGQLSDMSMTQVMRRMGLDAVPHGFRSTFRDWAAERTHYPREVAEAALAHTLENKVEAAYRRGDLLAKRAEMMADWARFCGTVRPAAKVVPLQRAKA